MASRLDYVRVRMRRKDGVIQRIWVKNTPENVRRYTIVSHTREARPVYAKIQPVREYSILPTSRTPQMPETETPPETPEELRIEEEEIVELTIHAKIDYDLSNGARAGHEMHLEAKMTARVDAREIDYQKTQMAKNLIWVLQNDILRRDKNAKLTREVLRFGSTDARPLEKGASKSRRAYDEMEVTYQHGRGFLRQRRYTPTWNPDET